MVRLRRNSFVLAQQGLEPNGQFHAILPAARRPDALCSLRLVSEGVVVFEQFRTSPGHFLTRNRRNR
jgi:hypothetical protein